MNNRSGGVGFLGLLTLLFIGLKLGGAITWSWWWVLSPIWIPAVIGVIALFIAVKWTMNQDIKKTKKSHDT